MGCQCQKQKCLPYHHPVPNNTFFIECRLIVIVSLRSSATYLICDGVWLKSMSSSVDPAMKLVSLYGKVLSLSCDPRPEYCTSCCLDSPLLLIFFKLLFQRFIFLLNQLELIIVEVLHHFVVRDFHKPNSFIFQPIFSFFEIFVDIDGY